MAFFTARTSNNGYARAHRGRKQPTRYLERFTLDPADIALRATTYARKTLMAGFTTVRGLGGSGVNVSLRISDQLGTIEAGKLADIIALDGNPLEDITVLQEVQFVMKDGRVYR